LDRLLHTGALLATQWSGGVSSPERKCSMCDLITVWPAHNGTQSQWDRNLGCFRKRWLVTLSRPSCARLLRL